MNKLQKAKHLAYIRRYSFLASLERKKVFHTYTRAMKRQSCASILRTDIDTGLTSARKKKEKEKSSFYGALYYNYPTLVAMLTEATSHEIECVLRLSNYLNGKMQCSVTLPPTALPSSPLRCFLQARYFKSSWPGSRDLRSSDRDGARNDIAVGAHIATSARSRHPTIRVNFKCSTSAGGTSNSRCSSPARPCLCATLDGNVTRRLASLFLPFERCIALLHFSGKAGASLKCASVWRCTSEKRPHLQ